MTVWLDPADAPRDGGYVEIGPRLPDLPWRITMSDPIALLCRDTDLDAHFAIVVLACWSTKDDEGGWWNLDAEEPLDLDVLGWMPLKLKEVASDLICPICAEPFKPDDLCATDITEGTCHAECLEGSPVVDLDSGDEIDGPMDTYRFDSLPQPRGGVE